MLDFEPRHHPLDKAIGAHPVGNRNLVVGQRIDLRPTIDHPLRRLGGQVARLVPAGSVEAMADAVCDLLTDPGAARAMSAAARSVAARSDWPPVRDAWLDLAAGFSRPSRGG